jgi:uncharacterized membrane protein YagU involved in acid resistance
MNRKLAAILTGGLIAGTMDICYAVGYSYLRSGVAPKTILQSVASGLLGRDAYSGGTATATLGFALHFLMALAIAAIYLLAARWLPALIRRPYLYGSLYGLVVYLFMNLVVLPLSRMPPRGAMPALLTIVTSIIVHMFLVGVPIALASRRALR